MLFQLEGLVIVSYTETNISSSKKDKVHKYS